MAVAPVLASELGATLELAVTVIVVAWPLVNPPTVCPGLMAPVFPLGLA